MDMLELLASLGIMVFLTILYFFLRKFIVWAIDDDAKWHKKRGHIGPSNKQIKTDKELALFRLTGGYLLILFLFFVYIGKSIFTAT